MPSKIILSDAQQDSIVESYVNGKTIPQIVVAQGISYHAVRCFIKKKKLTRDRGNIDSINSTKICVRCRIIKSLNEFNRNKATGGYRSECKNCRAVRSKTIARKYSELSSEEKRVILDRNRAIKLQYPERLLLKFAKARAKKTGLPFSIVEEDITIPTHCPILGIPIKFNKKTVQDDSVTLDRIICSLGYVKGNIQVISWKANKIKSNGTIEDFKLIIKYLQEHEVQT